MTLAISLRQALQALSRHKLRTFLTLLGMIFGVGAVIAMLSVGEGAQREALALIDMMGRRNVIVRARPQPEEKLQEVRKSSLGLSESDLSAALDTLPFIEAAGVRKKIRTYALFGEGGHSSAAVYGVSPSHAPMLGLSVGRGRLLHPLDDRYGRQVCVVGERVARELFGPLDPIGRPIKINHLWFVVVGVYRSRGEEEKSFEGVAIEGVQHQIHLPIRTALSRFRFKPMEEEIDEMQFRIAPGTPVAAAAATIGRLLRTRHRGIDDFELIVPEALLAQHRRTQQIFNIVMGCIAGISLLVGGIGIMNIMLSNVLERTREIGIHRAVGARRKDIRRQFIIEAFAVSAIGGLLGIVLGFALAVAITLYAGWPVAWSTEAILLAVGVCAGVGLVFGIYPAEQAAKLDPIEALRHD
ncbi:MAG: FtsX-like permease family protein [Deltaproteobacteria bacterium]|nr:MAG: FtsX-like permease family protein [Deltaproteobacteria bacterium]